MSFSEEKRKKLIIPAVALMMCAVAMIGIGFALQSTVTSSNSVTVNEFIANIGDYADLNSENMDMNKEINNKLTFTVEKTNEKNGTNNDYKYEISNKPHTCIVVKSNNEDNNKYELNVTTSIDGLVIEFYETTDGITKGNLVASISDSKSVSGCKAGTSDVPFKFNTNKIYLVSIEDIIDGKNVSTTTLSVTFTAMSV